MHSRDIIDIYVVGDIDENIVEIFKRYLPFAKKIIFLKLIFILLPLVKICLLKLKNKISLQAKLNMGYEIQTKFSDLDHYALQCLMVFLVVLHTHYYLKSFVKCIVFVIQLVQVMMLLMEL